MSCDCTYIDRAAELNLLVGSCMIKANTVAITVATVALRLSNLAVMFLSCSYINVHCVNASSTADLLLLIQRKEMIAYCVLLAINADCVLINHTCPALHVKYSGLHWTIQSSS